MPNPRAIHGGNYSHGSENGPIEPEDTITSTQSGEAGLPLSPNALFFKHVEFGSRWTGWFKKNLGQLSGNLKLNQTRRAAGNPGLGHGRCTWGTPLGTPTVPVTRTVTVVVG